MEKYWYDQLKEFGSKNIILGVAGNKCDMYEKEEVPESEGKQFADKIGAFFEITSAKNNTGIKDLFMNAANKFVDPSYIANSKEDKDQNEEGTVKLDEKEHKEKRKGCC